MREEIGRWEEGETIKLEKQTRESRRTSAENVMEYDISSIKT
jgi:hypothetical protein